MEQIASDGALDQAYEWLCDRRTEYPDHSDVWQVRWQWDQIKPPLQADLLAGRYRLHPVEQVQCREETLELWSALDALVLKATAMVLTPYLSPYLSEQCYHLAGKGGAKAAVRAVKGHTEENTFVFRTDVKSYYASMDHTLLFAQLQQHIDDPRVLDLLRGYIYRTVYADGIYQDIARGISLGCSLSPLMGALYLKPLDDRMAALGLFYARFMDDWVILAPTRWKLRKAIKAVNETLAALKVEQHPDKTFIGRISSGFDFLGYAFSPSGLGIASKTVERFVERITRLYEQGADSNRIGEYVRHWHRWVAGGLGKSMGIEGLNWPTTNLFITSNEIACAANYAGNPTVFCWVREQRGGPGFLQEGLS